MLETTGHSEMEGRGHLQIKNQEAYLRIIGEPLILSVHFVSSKSKPSLRQKESSLGVPVIKETYSQN